MIQAPANKLSQQYDDYLDLLNYAKQIGDQAWQTEILHTLETLHDWKEEAHQEELEEQLWRQFDQVNAKMMDLFVQLRRSEDEVRKQMLLDQMWELKMERIMISQQIKSCSA